jgi:hypothetical protein
LDYGKDFVNLIYEFTKPIIDPFLEALKNPSSLQNNFQQFGNSGLPTIK